MMKIRVETIDSDKLMADVQAAVLRAEERIGADIVAAQARAIASGTTPTGGAQKRNSPGVARKKGGKPPLLDTGRLRDGTRTVRTSAGVEVVPPADRIEAVAKLRAKGYTTIFDELPDDDYQKILDAETAKIDVSKSVRRVS